MDMGLANAVIMVRETGDLRYLVDLICALNAGQKPVLERTAVEAYLEDDCEDPEALMDEVLDFLYKANVSRLRLKKLDLLPKTEDKEEKPELKA